MKRKPPIAPRGQRNLASVAALSQDGATLNETTIIAATLCGAALGAGLVWLFGRQRISAAVAESEARSQAAHAEEKLALSKSLATAEANESSARSRIADLQRERDEREQALAELRRTKGEADSRVAALDMQISEEREQAAEKLALLDTAEKKLTDTFRALSAQALQNSNASFLELANATLGKFQEKATGDLAQKQQAIAELLAPVRESLARVDTQMNEIEKTRAGAYEGLIAQVKSLGETQQQLRGETGRLASVLRSTGARGRWGEIQLRRVVELAGMQDHCDFYEQQTGGGEGGRLRPDMLVKMPGGKTIVVDSKVPFSAYDRAISANDDVVRAAAYREHAQAVREHIKALSAKSYWEQFGEAPEFVVLFLPAETFFGAAVEHDPELIEFSAEKNVMLTTPMTLIALLRAVHYGWRQEKLAENAKLISELGAELYERLSKLGEHFAKVGKSLGSAVDAYNDATRSLETRVFVTARKFKDLHAANGGKEIEEPKPLEQTARSLQAPELLGGVQSASQSSLL
ncbi:MAG: DNA recombination protein RmuC [Chthoniobacteraceae bacterium]